MSMKTKTGMAIMALPMIELNTLPSQPSQLGTSASRSAKPRSDLIVGAHCGVPRLNTALII